MNHKAFNILRWVCMTLSFVFILYGVRFTGKWFWDYVVPSFFCPDTDGALHSSCYYLTHLNELFEYSSTKYIITFFASTIGFSIIFGRVLCGFFCPIGYLQDIVWKVREILHIEGINRKERFVRIMKVSRYLILMVFFGTFLLGIDFCDICPIAPYTYAMNGITHSFTAGYVLSAVLLAMSFFMRRFWCNICPLGFIVGLFHKITPFKLRKNPVSCTKCGACYEACPMKIKDIYTQSKKKDVTATECIFCGECIRKCPEDDALSITAGPFKVYTSRRVDFTDGIIISRTDIMAKAIKQKMLLDSVVTAGEKEAIRKHGEEALKGNVEANAGQSGVKEA